MRIEKKHLPLQRQNVVRERETLCFHSRNSSWTFLTTIRGHSLQVMPSVFLTTASSSPLDVTSVLAVTFLALCRNLPSFLPGARVNSPFANVNSPTMNVKSKAKEKMNFFEIFKQRTGWSEEEVRKNVRVI